MKSWLKRIFVGWVITPLTRSGDNHFSVMEISPDKRYLALVDERVNLSDLLKTYPNIRIVRLYGK